MNNADRPVLDELIVDLDRPYRLLAFGDPNVDLMFAVAHAPASDQKVMGRSLGRFAGGTVANAGCAAAAMGCRTQAVGRVGSDEDGHFLRAAFVQHGVSVDLVQTVAAAHSACAMIMLEPGGEKALVYAPLPGTAFDMDTMVTALTRSSVLYAMPYDSAEFTGVHALARASGTVVVIDIESAMAPRAGDIERLLGHADVVFMNATTYVDLFGRAPDTGHMRSLLAHGVKVLVVTCGAAGALAVTQRGVASQSARVVTVLDSTGAGDCFNGAFVAALLEGQSLRACLRFACAAASFVVAQVGARSGVPTRARVDALLAAWQV